MEFTIKGTIPCLFSKENYMKIQKKYKDLLSEERSKKNTKPKVIGYDNDADLLIGKHCRNMILTQFCDQYSSLRDYLASLHCARAFIFDTQLGGDDFKDAYDQKIQKLINQFAKLTQTLKTPLPEAKYQDFEDGISSMDEMVPKIDEIFSDFGLFLIKEISENIRSQIESASKRARALIPENTFVSLLPQYKDKFMEYERNLSDGKGTKTSFGKNSTSKSKKSPNRKNIHRGMKQDPFSSHHVIAEEEVYEDTEEEKKSGFIVRPKARGNSSGLHDQWDYKNLTTVVRKDEGHMIYYRNDSTQTQKVADIDSTVVLKSNIESRIKLLSEKQIPNLYDLQIHVHDSVIKTDKEGECILAKFLQNSFPDNVTRLTLFASLSKTGTEKVDDKLVDIIKKTISTCVKDYVYLPDWSFTKTQINSILNECTSLKVIDIRRNEAPFDENSKRKVQVNFEAPSLFKNLKRLYLVSNELNENEVKAISQGIINSHLLKQMEVVNLNHNATHYDYKLDFKDAGYENSFY
ncbi:unnamed protein product [Moneuplotes crassus]|uniref:Uncharacterized protein n=1 Tax=Euplotes crassus TaxID=5936 RepID=A0AAD1U6K7_EUPCR|nr:unnamed protein product [Moneuplotes crassus]